MYTNSAEHQHAGQVLSNSFKLFTCAFLKVLPVTLLLTIVVLGGNYLERSMIANMPSMAREITIAGYIISNLFEIFIAAYFILIFHAISTGTKASFSEMTARIKKRYIPLVGAYIIALILSLLGYVLGLYPLLIVTVYIMPLLAIGVLHDDGFVGIVGHCFRLANRRWWQTFFVMFLPMVIVYICQIGAAQNNYEGLGFGIAYFLLVSWLYCASYCQYINLRNRPVTEDHGKFSEALKERPRSIVTAAWLTLIYAVIMLCTVLIDTYTKANLIYTVSQSHLDAQGRLHMLYSHVFSLGMVIGFVVVFMCYTFFGSRAGRIMLIIAALLSAVLYLSHAYLIFMNQLEQHMILGIIHVVVAILNLLIAYFALKSGHWTSKVSRIFSSASSNDLHAEAIKAESK